MYIVTKMIRFFQKNRYFGLVIAAFYLYVTITIPFYHTCRLNDSFHHTKIRAESPSYSLQVRQKHVNEHLLSRAKDRPTEITHLCLACLYSITANAPGVCATTTVYLLAPNTSSAPKHPETIIDKRQQFTPILLRAPPDTIS